MKWNLWPFLLFIQIIKLKPSACLKFKIPKFLSFFELWTSQKLLTWPLLSILSPTYLVFPQFQDLNSSLEEDFTSELLYLLQERGDHAVLSGAHSSDFLRTKHHLFHSLSVVIVIPQIPTRDQLSQLSETIRNNLNKKRDQVLFVANLPPRAVPELYKNPTISELRNKMTLCLQSFTIYQDPPTYNFGLPISLSYNQLLHRKSPPSMAFNLRGRHFRMAGCVDTPPYHFIRSAAKSPNEPSVEDGTEYRIFVASSIAFNFSFDSIFEPGTGYATYTNGKWTGMISNLIYTERKFDFTVTFAQLASFYPMFDYLSTPSCYLRLSFVQALHGSELVAWDAIVSPFAPDLWFAVILSYLIVCCCVFTVVFCHPNPAKRPSSIESLFVSLYVPFEIAMEQSIAVPRHIQSILLCWIIITIITGSAYRTVLLSILTFPSFPPVPETFAELALRPDYTIMLHVMGSVETQFFQESSSTPVKSINSRLKLISADQGPTCFFGAAYHEKTACFAWFPDAKMKMAAMGIINENNIQNEPFKMSRDAGMYTTLSVPFQKDSIFSQSFAPIIGALLDTGIHEKWREEIGNWFKLNGLREIQKKRKLGEALPGENAKEEDHQPLKMKNLLVVYLILVVGLATSIVAFWGEFRGIKRSSSLFSLKMSWVK